MFAYLCGYMHMRAGTQRGQRHWIPLDLELYVCELPSGYWELSHLQVQCTLLATEPYVAPNVGLFFYSILMKTRILISLALFQH